MAALIEAEGVSKLFRQHRRFPGMLGALRTLVTRQFTEVAAVRDIGFAIREGEAVGYLGPNGAGKSTMIKMMTGILVPTSGRLSVLGRTPHLERQLNARDRRRFRPAHATLVGPAGQRFLPPASRHLRHRAQTLC